MLLFLIHLHTRHVFKHVYVGMTVCLRAREERERERVKGVSRLSEGNLLLSVIHQNNITGALKMHNT